MVEQPEIIQKLIRHERALSMFYEHCATNFPQDVNLWQKLAQEEENHAKILEVLAGQVSDGKAFVDELKFKIKAVESSLKYVEELTRKVESGRMTRVGAMSAALDLEKASLDSSFFTIFKTDWKALADQIEKVAQATCAHRDRLVAAVTELRKAGGK